MNIRICIIIFSLMTMSFSAVSYADDLGRLFTSAKDRKKLDYVRNKPSEVVKPVEDITIEIPDIEETVEDNTPKVSFDIKLKGLVYRQNGKSTAWVNEGNTYEGNLETQYIQIPETDIKDNSVKIVMPDKETSIQLKVGDNYVPQKEEEQQKPPVED